MKTPIYIPPNGIEVIGEYAERSDEMISLSVKEYSELMRKAELVDALYAAGVENWDGYIDAMAMVSAV